MEEIKFLHEIATIYSIKSPALSRIYIQKRNELIKKEKNTEIKEEETCQRCNSFFIPSINCEIKLETKAEINKEMQKEEKNKFIKVFKKKTDNYLVYKCLVCSTKTLFKGCIKEENQKVKKKVKKEIKKIEKMKNEKKIFFEESNFSKKIQKNKKNKKNDLKSSLKDLGIDLD
jgi:activator of 2-hydroxyglutaryl-CoA dehydratase